MFEEDNRVNLTRKGRTAMSTQLNKLKNYERYTQHLHGLVTVTIEGLK